MKAIILAAGMGTRLGKYTENLPKGMLEFNGKPLIQWQIETLRSCEIKDIIIVTGYMPEKIKFKGIIYYHNEDFANTNMVESLMKAESEMDDDILVCYSDILYEKRIIEKIKSADVDIGVTVDSDYQGYWEARLDNPQGDMESLVIENRTIADLGDPNCQPEQAQYRYVGLIKFSKKGIDIFKKIYKENRNKYFDTDEPWLRSKSFKKAYMTCMLQAIINAGRKVSPIQVQHGWLEFDTVGDYEKYTAWLSKGKLSRFFRF